MSLEQVFFTTELADDQDALTPDALVALSTAPAPIDAKSMSSTLLPLLQASDFPLTCLSRHDHACNFQTADGAIIALVTPQHGNGPFHIVLPHRLPPQLVNDDNRHAHWQQGALFIGSLSINLHRAAIWQPDLPALYSVSFDVHSSLHEIICRYPLSVLHDESTIVGKRAQQGIEALQMGFAQEDSDNIRRGVLYLSGLGPGLTPAGDDFLVGLLAALYACRLQTDEEPTKVSQLIGQTAAAQTTQLSAQWLRYAGQGHFGEAWHNLIAALNGNDKTTIATAAHRILTTGATSGVDAMSGFLFGTNLLEDRR